MKKTKLEDILIDRLHKANLLSVFETQVRFEAGSNRRWRFDLYSRAHRLAVEVEGGTFRAGRHSRGVGMSEDMEKYNEAVLRNIRLLRFDSTMILPAPHHKHPPKSKAAARRRTLEGVAVDVVRRALFSDNDRPYAKRPRRAHMTRK